MDQDRIIADEAMRIAQAEDEYLSIGCDVERRDGYTVLTSNVCPDMWDANHVRRIDLACNVDLDAFISRMETLFREMNREHCRFDIDFRTRPQHLTTFLRRRSYACTRGVVQVCRAPGKRAAFSWGTDTGGLQRGVVEISSSAPPGQFDRSTLADWACLERASYSEYDSPTGFAHRAAQLAQHRLECAWKMGLDLRVFLAYGDLRSESASKRDLAVGHSARVGRSVEVDHGAQVNRSTGGAVGKCELFRSHGAAKIESLYVMPGARDAGVGAALLSRARDSAIAAGDDLVYLVAAADDWPRYMYPRFGFVDLMETNSWLKMLDQDADQADFLIW